MKIFNMTKLKVGDILNRDKRIFVKIVREENEKFYGRYLSEGNPSGVDFPRSEDDWLSLLKYRIVPVSKVHYARLQGFIDSKVYHEILNENI